MTFYTILPTTGGLINGERKKKCKNEKNGNKRLSVSCIFLIFYLLSFIYPVSWVINGG